MHKAKFFSGLLLAIIFIVSVVYFLNRSAFQTVYQNREALAEGSEWVEKTYSLAGLIDYIEGNPEYVSVTSLNLTYPDQSIRYHDEKPRVAGAVGHIVLLGTWMEAVGQGRFPADSLVALEDIERFHVPNVASSSHRAGMGLLYDQSEDEYVQLKAVVQNALKNNHLASADFWYDLLGFERIDSFRRYHFGDDIETPLPWSGFYILAQPMLHGQPAGEKLKELSSIPRDSLYALNLDRFSRYQSDEEYRSQVQQAFGGDGHNLNFIEQRKLYNLLPRATTYALARFAEKIFNEELISTEASQQMYDLMNWPLEEQATRRHLERYGAVYDNRMSLLGGIDFGESAYTGERYAQAILYDDMPIGLWMHMSSNFMNQDYQKRLMYDPELHRRSVSALTDCE